MGIVTTASDYRSTRPTGPRLSRRDLSFGGAIAEKWGKEENKFLAVLDMLASGQQGLAGIATEIARRETGHAPTPVLDAFKGGMARSASFSEVTGDPYTGLVADVIIDPVNIPAIPGVPGVGAAAKAFGRIPKVARTGARIYEATEASNNIRKAKEAFGHLFKNKHLFKKRNPKEVTKMLEDHRGEINFHLHTAGKKVAIEIAELVPDGEKRMKLGVLMDSEPVIKQEGSFEFERWKELFDILDPDEKTAYLMARTHFDALEKLKLESGLITEGRIAGFYEKFQRKYVPFRTATKDNIISDINNIKQGVAKGDQSAIEIVGRFDKGMEELDALLDAAERTDDIWLSFRERARKMYQAGEMPSWSKARKTTQTMGEVLEHPEDAAIVAKTEKLIEADIAKLAHIEAREVATAYSSREYSRKLIEFMRKENLIFPAKMKNSEISLVMQNKMSNAALTKALNAGTSPDYTGVIKTVKSRLREGFKTVPDVEALRGFQVPATLADEIASVVKRTSDPNLGKKILGFIQKATQWDKAWRLAPFPEFHTRNYFSNKFNMMLGGFGPQDFKHYRMGTRLVWRWSNGEGLYERAGKGAGRFFGMTERELYESALKHRVIGSGETMGELGMLFDQHAVRGNIFSRFIDPRTSPIIKSGFKVGRWIEDGDRLAYWMSQMDRGLDAGEAARKTNKFLLDYRHGLSGFESEYLRNAAMPFYAWLKMNMLLQVEMLALQPHKYVPFIKGKKFMEDQFGGPEPKMIEEADWIRKNISMRVGYDKKTGHYKYFLFNSWWPAADLDKLWGTKLGQELINQVNPWIKVPVEIFKNYSLFQERKIQDYPGQKKKLLGVSLPIRFQHLLRTFRQVNTTDKVLQSMFPEEGATKGTLGWGFMQIMAGKVYPQDPKKQAKWWKYGKEREIRYMKGKLKGAKKRGEKENVKILEREIKKTEDLKRKHLGITG